MPICVEEPERIREAAESLMETLDLDLYPVAMKLYLSEGDVPDDYERVKEECRHCEFVMAVARGEMDKIYATPEEQACKGGSAAIGLDDIPDPVRTGKFYYEGLGQHATLSASKRTVELVPKAFDGEGVFEAITYEKATGVEVVPDVILVVCKPKEAMKIAQAYLYPEGGRVYSDFSGIQSLCGDGVGKIVKEGGINFTLGCNGSRAYAKVPDECLVVAMSTTAFVVVGHSVTEIP
ncbi:DUF169 domain-containing protein [Methanopyrus kandleri]